MLPGKTGDKIKIVIEKSIFMAVFSFLLHTIQDFVRFLTGIFIHAGFLDLFFKSTDIGNVFRVHLI